MNTDKIKEKIKNPLKLLKPKTKKKTKKQRVKQEAFDWIISIAIALLIYFVILPAILNTQSPMVIVSSCSQEPHLNIGDVLIIQGTDTESVEAPTIQPKEGTEYSYDEYSESLIVNGEQIHKNQSNDIVVYFTHPQGTQVIHRALVKLNTTRETYLLTQGDANEIPDQITRQPINGQRKLCLEENPTQCISTAINDEMLVGRKVGWRIPLLGHVKLFFCDIIPFCDGHANPGTNYEYKLTC